MQPCIFCRLANGELPTKLLYEDDYVVAFPDQSPVAPVHVLIVPKTHHTNVLHLADDPESGLIMASVLKAAKEIAAQFDLTEQGFRLINNCGEGAGQTVMHVHVHLIGGQKLSEKLLASER